MKQAPDLSRRAGPGRRALITGGGSGLGCELGRRLCQAGWSVGLVDVAADRLTAAVDALAAAGSDVLPIVSDVRDPVEMGEAVAAMAAWRGGLDLLVANAGVAVGGSFLDTPEADWTHALGVNLLGVVNSCRAALPGMWAQGAGHIHIVASAAGFMASPMMAAYNASKAATVAVAETLQGELAGTGVSVSLSLPAFFKTGLLDGLRAPPAEAEAARLLTTHSGYTVEGAADDILRGIAGGDFYIFAPRRVRLLWRWKRLAPDHYRSRFPTLRLRRIERLCRLDAAGR